MILALNFINHSSVYKDWVQHKKTAYMMVNPITLNNFASLFGCTPAGLWRLRPKDF